MIYKVSKAAQVYLLKNNTWEKVVCSYGACQNLANTMKHKRPFCRKHSYMMDLKLEMATA